MWKLEILALTAMLAVLFGTPVATFGYESYLRSQNANEITLVGRTQEDGGWSLPTIRVKQGEEIKLRLTSDDVAHGLAIPGLGIDVPEIYPGKYTTVEFTAARPGTYPFVCTVLCSPKHGQMRGQIIIEGIAGQG